MHNLHNTGVRFHRPLILVFGLAALCTAALGAALMGMDSEHLLCEGKRLLRHKQYRRARAVFALMIRNAPWERRGYEGCAEAWMRLGRADLAFDVLLRGADYMQRSSMPGKQ